MLDCFEFRHLKLFRAIIKPPVALRQGVFSTQRVQGHPLGQAKKANLTRSPDSYRNFRQKLSVFNAFSEKRTRKVEKK